jgi:signal transduction histidine kinase
MTKSLQQKSTRYFLIWLPLVLLVGTGLFYILMSKHAHHMEEEQLELKQENIWNAIVANPGGSATHITGEYDLAKGSAVRSDWQDIMRDTAIYYPAGKDWRPFKLLTEQHALNGQPYQLTTYISSREITHLIIKVFVADVFVFVLLLAGIVVINRISSGLLWQPFYVTLKGVQTYDINQNQSLLLDGQTGTREFDQLNQVITQLIGHVNQAYSNQKQFTENASHELQTPLAIIRSKLDLLIDSSTLTEETAGLLADITEANDRLSQLNKNLLLLTKIDNHQLADQSSVGLSDAIEKLLAHYLEHHGGDLPVVRKAIQPGIGVKANPALIEILLSNLIKNAFVHNIPNGFIDVRLDNRALIVENSGHSIEGEPERLFERFKKGREDSKTTGLGLSLVQRICRIYHFELQYHYAENVHRITVTFGTA